MICRGERGEHGELLGEGRQGLLGLPRGVIGAGWMKRVVGGVRDGGWVILAVRVRGIGTRGVRGVLWVGIVVVMGLRMVLVVLIARTGARRGVATALGVDTRGRRGMGMAVDGRDGVLVLVWRMAGCVGGVGKGREVGGAGVGVCGLWCSHGRGAQRRAKGAGRRGGRRGRQPARARAIKFLRLAAASRKVNRLVCIALAQP